MTLAIERPPRRAPHVRGAGTRRQFIRGGLGLGAAVLIGCGDDDEGAATASADGGKFPVTIEHELGRTTIEGEPKRVVTLNERDTDIVLALGVTPVAMQSNYGFEKGIGPWAENALGRATPKVFKGRELNYEAIAALRPDLIVHTTSGGEREVYDSLAKIAPTVGLPEAAIPYSAPTEAATLLIAKALGRTDAGRREIQALESYLERRARPAFEGRTVNYLDISPGQVSSYSRRHPINSTMYKLGFEPIGRSVLPKGKYFVSVSTELLESYDADVVLAYLFERSLDEVTKELPTLARLDSVRNGRFVVLEDVAFSNSSVLSLPYALDRLLPDIERSLA